MAYILPQVQVFQIFRQLPRNVVRNLNAFVFGPQYQLFRYSEPSEKKLINVGLYNINNDVTYNWPNKPEGSVVDTSYVKVFAENVWALYQSIPANDDYEARIVSSDERNKVRIGAMVLKTANGFIRSASLLRDVKTGDVVKYTYISGNNEYTGVTKVVDLEADTVPASISNPQMASTNETSKTASATVVAGSNNKMTGYNPVVAGSFTGVLSEGVVSDIITVKVTNGGNAQSGQVRVSVSYQSGIYNRENVPLVANSDNEDAYFYIGHGLYLQIPAAVEENATFYVDDIFTVTVTANYTALSSSNITVGGIYTGNSKTSYIVEVLRGGLFDRNVKVTAAETNTSTGVIKVNPGPNPATQANWNYWFGGDNDDEYILRCTTGGNSTNAVFSLSSLNGDYENNIKFNGDNKVVAIGNFGLYAVLTGNGTYTAGDFWIIKVNASRPLIKISDSAGIDSSVTTIVDNGVEIDLGEYGVEATFNPNSNTEGVSGSSGGLLKGQRFYIHATPAVEAAVKTLVLADELNSNIPAGQNIALNLYSVQNGIEIPAKRYYIPSEYNWTADSNGITIKAGLKVIDPSWVNSIGVNPWLPVHKATLFIQYRALIKDNADSIKAIGDISDIVTTLGTIHPDNPLAQGVYNALLNSGNREVYYMAVPSNDVEGWSHVLDRATLHSDVYGFVPLTRDSSILDMVQSHIHAMSTETAKKWRIAFVGSNLPTTKTIYDKNTNPNKEEFLAKVSKNSEGKNVIVSFVNADGSVEEHVALLSNVRPGDRVRINFAADAWGDTIYEDYKIVDVISNTTLEIEGGPDQEIEVPSKIEVYRPLTINEIAEEVGHISAGFYSHRMYHVFPPTLSSNGVVMTSEFAAAAIAGLTSSVAPQQPITNIEIVGFDDLPMVYRTFNQYQLNKMAEYGTLILMQENVNGRVYVRHQLSTKAVGNNLNETELSIIKNFDSICYYFAARFEPYIGRYNITPDMLNIISAILSDGLNYLGSVTGVGLISPQVILEETEIVGVQQHPIFKDHVVATVNIGLPKPFNVLQLRLVV